jgi:pimeloyl-ACP methyl ester carboxylesterase
MKRVRFIEQGLTCDVFQPDGTNEDTPGALYLYGFPGSIGENSVTRFLLSEGYVVLQPHYPGTYDSDGTFTPDSAVGMTAHLQTLVERGEAMNVKNMKPMGIPKQIEVCIGHSFGCFVALRAARSLPNLLDLVLLAPAITYGEGEFSCGIIENGVDHISYVQRSRPHTYRLGDTQAWLDLYAGKQNMMQQFKHPTLRSTIGVVGSNDPYFKSETLKNSFDSLIRMHLGTQSAVHLWQIAAGDHSSESLLNSVTSKALSENLKKR